MKQALALCGILLLLAGHPAVYGQDSGLQEIPYADPTITRVGDTYYLTGTSSQTPAGFTVLLSDNLEGPWRTGTADDTRFLLTQGESYGTTGFWAPQWIQVDNHTWGLAYTANEQTALAWSNRVTGPFRQDTLRPIDASAKNIDPFLFRDDDGRYYLYHVRFDHGNYIWVAEFDLQRGTIRPETLRRCLDNTEPWENTPSYPSVPIMEGPTVVKLDGVYYLFFSANHFMNIDYAVGYATSSSPLGPWEKHTANPIISRHIVGENGSGHGDIFRGKDRRLYYVYHVHASDHEVSPRRTRIVPLHLSKRADGLYDISVKPDEVIIPRRILGTAGSNAETIKLSRNINK